MASVALWAVVVMASSGAPPQEWAKSFSTPAVRAHFEDETVLLVPVGEKAQAAAAALATVLRSAPPRRLSNVGSMSDQEILAALRNTEARRIAVVRVYPGSGGGAPLAAVTLYGPDGKPLTSFFARQGEPHEQPRTGGPGGDSVSGALEGITRVDRNVDEKFVRANYIDFEEMVVLRDGVKMSQHSIPYRGDQHERIGWDEFYRTVGRKDLADRMTRDTWTRLGLALGAVVVGLGSFAIAAPIGLGGAGPVALIIIGVGLTGALVMAGIAAFAIPAMPVTMLENRKLADEYNQKLARGEIRADSKP
jgi:hypothetical protein